MKLIGNAMNGQFMANIIPVADSPNLRRIVMGVAYVHEMGSIFDLASRRGVPLTLYALVDESGFPSIPVVRRFVQGSSAQWRLFLTRDFFHPKLLWFDGVGCYIGSANLTKGGWWDNLECGVWFSHEELRQNNWEDEIEAMFRVTRDRSREAQLEDVKRLEALAAKRRTGFDAAQGDLKKYADKLFDGLPGQTPVIRHAGKLDAGGEARRRFIEDFDSELTLLRKLGGLTKEIKWPLWVDSQVHPAVAFDQATEYWYTIHVRDRKSERARDEAVEEMFQRHRSSPDRATMAALEQWAKFDGDHGGWEWPAWCNTNPRRLRELLQRPRLQNLTIDELAEVVWLVHACREHARQVNNSTLGLPNGAKMDLKGRCRVYAEYLSRQRTEKDREVREVLDFAIWGESLDNHAGRIWDATHAPEWKLPHLGTSILGEMIGYARPDDCPPRNQRVVRTLRALGYEVDVA